MALLKISSTFKILTENFFKFSVYFCITCIISIHLCECRSIRYFHHKEVQGHCRPNTYYDVRHEKCRSLPEGGEVAVIDYNKVCADKFIGPKPHPKRKEYFYLCKNDSVVLGKCSDSMIYNSSTRKCELANMVPCLEGSNNSSCSKPGRYPVQSNCSQFYICNRDGRQYYKKVLQCPGTKAFNPLTQRCSYKYKCTPTVAFSSYSPTENDDDDFPPCKQPGRFRSPTNCALYYTCGLKRQGKFNQRRYRCPDGQLFDSSSKVCLDASEVKCEYTTPQNLTQLSNIQESIYYEESLENNDESAEDSLFNVDKAFNVKNVEATTESGSTADEPYDSEYMHETSVGIVNEMNDTDLSVPLTIEDDSISANVDHMEDPFTSSLDTTSSNQVADSTVVESQNFNNINNALILNNVRVNNGNLNLSIDDANDNITIVQTESTSQPHITEFNVATVTTEVTTSSSIDSEDPFTSASVSYSETHNTANSVIFDNSYNQPTSLDSITKPTTANYVDVSDDQQVSTEASSLNLENSLSNNLTENTQVETISETETMAEMMEIMQMIQNNHQNNMSTRDAILKLAEITQKTKESILRGKQPGYESSQTEEIRQENLSQPNVSIEAIHASQDNSAEKIQNFQDNVLTESPGYVELNRTNVESETNQDSQNTYVEPGTNSLEVSQIKTGTETDAYSQTNSAPEGITQLDLSPANTMNETGGVFQDTYTIESNQDELSVSNVTSATGTPKNDYEHPNSVSQNEEPSTFYGEGTSLGTRSDSQAVQNEAHVSSTPQVKIDEAGLKTQTESTIALGTVNFSDPHMTITHNSIVNESYVHQGVVASNKSPEFSEQNELIPYDDASTNGSVTISEQMSSTSKSEECQKNLQPFQYGPMSSQNYNMDNKFQVICGPTNITDFNYPSSDVVLLNVFKPIRLIINFDPQGVPTQELVGDVERNSSTSKFREI